MVLEVNHVYQLLVSILFILTVVLIALEKIERYKIAAIAIILLLITQAITFEDFVHYVDWDVLGMIMCMNIYSVVLEISGFAKWIAYRSVSRVRKPLLLLYTVILLSGIVSLVLENAVTVLIFAPIAFEIASLLNINVKELLIGIALAAGMAGSATMVGDPPAIIVAGRYNLAFTDFFIYSNKLSMFFIVFIPMIIATATHVIQNFKHLKNSYIDIANVYEERIDRVFVLETTIFLFIKIILLSFRKELGIPLTLSALTALIGLYIVRIAIHRDTECIIKSIKEGLDYRLPLFLIAIFLLSNSLKKYGITDIIANSIVKNIGENLAALGITIFIISTTLSAFIENIPVTLTLLPIVDSIAMRTGVDALILAWGILAGLTAGGGFTYIGSGANVVAVHILDSKNAKTKFAEFIKIALPFNITNTILVLTLYTFIWLQ
jgi:Na+/H+ antiporter NhaD/arsenite permease-like protein